MSPTMSKQLYMISITRIWEDMLFPSRRRVNCHQSFSRWCYFRLAFHQMCLAASTAPVADVSCCQYVFFNVVMFFHLLCLFLFYF